MHSQMKVMKRGDQITLVSSNGGKGFLWLLVLELAVLAALLVHLGNAVGPSVELALAAVPCVGLLIWTGTHIKPDLRIVMDVGQRQGKLVRISPITGARTVTSFSLDDVEGLALRQIGEWSATTANKYVVDMQLRCGARHVLSAHGSLFVYNQVVAQFSGFTGIHNRIVRLPAA